MESPDGDAMMRAKATIYRVEWGYMGRFDVIGKIMRWIGRDHVFVVLSYTNWPDMKILVESSRTRGVAVLPMDERRHKRLIETVRPLDWIELDVLMPTRRGRAFSCVEPLSCVTLVKRLTGMRSPWIVTPRQLFRELRKNG